MDAQPHRGLGGRREPWWRPTHRPGPRPSRASSAQVGRLTREDALQRAAEHGDEHVLKFADTAVEAYDRTGDPDLLAATLRVGSLIPQA